METDEWRMANRLSEKVCIITGTGGGMGREAASHPRSRICAKILRPHRWNYQPMRLHNLTELRKEVQLQSRVMPPTKCSLKKARHLKVAETANEGPLQFGKLSFLKNAA